MAIRRPFVQRTDLGTGYHGVLPVGDTISVYLPGTSTAVAVLHVPTMVDTTIASNTTLTAAYLQYQYLDPNGGIYDVSLWASPLEAQMVYIHNTGTSGRLVVKDSNDTELAVLTADEAITLIYTGTAWRQVL